MSIFEFGEGQKTARNLDFTRMEGVSNHARFSRVRQLETAKRGGLLKQPRRTLFPIVILALLPGVWAQPAATPRSILISTVSALGGTKIQGLTMTGTAEAIAGATDDTGTFTASCGIDGASQLSIQAGDSSRTETRQIVNGMPSGSWTDREGQPHAMAYHNILTPSAWFCPVVALMQIVSTANLNIQYAGPVMKNGASAEHFIVNLPVPGKHAQQVLMSHLSQVDIYLNSQTLRPIDFDFTAHPDNNSSVDIAIEVTFANYAETNGVWMPTAVERYVNSSLALRLQIHSATPITAQQ